MVFTPSSGKETTMTLHMTAPAPMILEGAIAEDLMTVNPISIHAGASVQEALAMMTDRGFSAAPVIDDAGRPVGVLSRTDLLVHQRERGATASLVDETDWDAPPRRMR